jgi:hypothetical protein
MPLFFPYCCFMLVKDVFFDHETVLSCIITGHRTDVNFQSTTEE